MCFYQEKVELGLFKVKYEERQREQSLMCIISVQASLMNKKKTKDENNKK